MATVAADRSSAFASDNAAPAHPQAIEAISKANEGPTPSYGDDPFTARASETLRAAFDSPDAEVLFAFTGTAANIIALAAAARPWHEILCSDIAHSLLDEAGGPVRLSGAQLTRLPSDDGILDPALLDRAVARRGEVHHSQPHIVTITQSTENGRVWSRQAINEFVDHAHELDLLVHVDGSRIANAIAALDVSPIASERATPTSSPSAAPRTACCSATRSWSAGPSTSTESGSCRSRSAIWRASTATCRLSSRRSCATASGWRTPPTPTRWPTKLSTGLDALGLGLAAPTEANEVFVNLEPKTHSAIAERYAIHAPDTLRPIYRFVCSWATTDDDVDAVLALLASPRESSERAQ